MLDAILSPEWESRYYSFNGVWSDDATMASMRNGSGDYWFALFCKAGVALHGLAHESPAFRPGKPWPGIFDRLPNAFHESFLREPAFTTEDSSFCVWRLYDDAVWSCGPVELPRGADPDGSAALLSILDGRPERYVAFANEYYEQEIEIGDVQALYDHQPLTEALVERLNADVDLEALADDAAEIGYPEGAT